jgi:hypothetical protein
MIAHLSVAPPLLFFPNCLHTFPVGWAILQSICRANKTDCNLVSMSPVAATQFILLLALLAIAPTLISAQPSRSYSQIGYSRGVKLIATGLLSSNLLSLLCLLFWRFCATECRTVLKGQFYDSLIPWKGFHTGTVRSQVQMQPNTAQYLFGPTDPKGALCISSWNKLYGGTYTNPKL